MRKIIITFIALGVLACGKQSSQGDGAGKAEAQVDEAAAVAKTTAVAKTAAPEPAAAGTNAPVGSENADAPSASADPAATDVAPEAVAVSGEVPTAEDFEERAAADVDKSNLEREVSKMEKELGVKGK